MANGMTLQNFSNKQTSGTLGDLIVREAIRNNININYIYTGRGAVYLSDRTGDTAPVPRAFAVANGSYGTPASWKQDDQGGDEDIMNRLLGLPGKGKKDEFNWEAISSYLGLPAKRKQDDQVPDAGGQFPGSTNQGIMEALRLELNKAALAHDTADQLRECQIRLREQEKRIAFLERKLSELLSR